MKKTQGTTESQSSAPEQPAKGNVRKGKAPPAKGSKREADIARYEALAREHGTDLSEEGFNEALRKVSRK